MKKITLAVAAALSLGVPAAFAQDAYWNSPQDPYYQSRDQNRWDERAFRDRDYDGRRDFARVIESRPVYAAGGRQECFNPRAGVYEEVREENRTRVGKGAAIGAVAGGVLGHQVDRGGGTAAGAVLGGLLGHHLEKRNDSNTQNDLDFSNCRVAGDPSGAQQGYEVRYEYNGREYTTFMNHDPGRRLRVGEDTRPDGMPHENVSWR
ncbi:MAG TPA: glycine zipper 2TM domain-containing protein [Usitatibacter sp.]|nr:glycine zipper 2TM domain-containing protein [Usitatibacter sp.]